MTKYLITLLAVFLTFPVMLQARDRHEPDMRSPVQVFVEQDDERGKYFFFGVVTTAVAVCLYHRCWKETAEPVPASDPDSLNLTPPEVRHAAAP